MVWGAWEVKTLHNAVALPQKENRSDSAEICFAMKRNLHESICGRYAFACKRPYAAAFLSVEHVLKSCNFERLLFGRGKANGLSQAREHPTFQNRATGPHTLRRIYIEA